MGINFLLIDVSKSNKKHTWTASAAIASFPLLCAFPPKSVPTLVPPPFPFLSSPSSPNLSKIRLLRICISLQELNLLKEIHFPFFHFPFFFENQNTSLFPLGNPFLPYVGSQVDLFPPKIFLLAFF